MENNNGKGIFYGVIGVATLVVAIIGATFAYFSATASNTTEVQGNAATMGLSLKVTKVSESGTTENMIPIADGADSATVAQDTENILTKALAATNQCVDSNNNTVCQVYQIEVKNDGTSVARLDGSLEITGANYVNLKWDNHQKNAGIATATAPTATTGNFALLDTKTPTAQYITQDESYAAGETKYYYITVYIDETYASQNDTDKGGFTGVVTFNSAGGTGTTASFTS